MSHAITPVSHVPAPAGPLAVPPALFAGAGGGDAPPPGLRRAVTPGTVLAALRRRWPLAAALGLALAAAGATAAWALRPEKYTAFAVLRVESVEPKILQQDAARPQESAAYLRTQLALLRSRPVLRAALRDERIRQLPLVQKQADPVEWLEKELAAEQVPGTELVRVSLTARGGGADLAPVVNAVVDAYMAGVVQTEHVAQQARLTDLNGVTAALESKINQLREAFQSMSRDLKGGDAKVLSLKQQTLLNEYSSLKGELAGANARVRDLELKLTTYRLRLVPAEPEGLFARAAHRLARPATVSAAVEALVERELAADPRVAAAEAEAAKAQEQLRVFEAVSADPNSGLRADLQAKVAAAEERTRQARADRRPGIAARHQLVGDAAARQQIVEAEAELGVIRGQRDALQAEVAALKAETDALGVNSVVLEMKRSEIERSEQFLRSVWEQRERLQAELNGKDKDKDKDGHRKRVSTVSRADDAAVLNRMGRAQEAAGAGLAGLLAGLLGAAAFDLRRNHIHTPADVSRGLGLRVIGALPKLPAAAAPLPAGEASRGALESVNGLRTALLSGAAGPTGAGGRPLALMVASAAPGEGKSTLAAQLAASFARAQKRTLLVDGDLRSPSLHRAFGLSNAAGVCEALAGTADAPGAAVPTGVPNLDLLPAGRFCRLAEAGLAQADQVRRVLAELRGRYDCIVIDSSPVLLVPDALMVGECVDGLIVSVRPGVSQATTVYAGYERLAEHRLPVLGVVVNGVPAAGAYSYGYGRPPEPPAAAV